MSPPNWQARFCCFALLLSPSLGYQGTPPPDRKLAERALNQPLTVNDYREALQAGVSVFLQPETRSKEIEEAGEKEVVQHCARF